MDARNGIEDMLHPLLGRYLKAPDWVKASAGRAYRALPDSLKLGGAYEEFRALVAGEHSVGPMARLEATLAWAIETVPAYAQYKPLLRGGRDPREILAALPITDKLDIKHDLERYLSRALPPSARLETFTGGSTRHPMRFFLHKHVTRPKEQAFMQDFRARVGATEADLVLAMRGRIVPTAAQPDGRLWMLEPIRRQLIVSCDHLERRYMPRYAEALSQHRPAIVEAFPSALYPLARWLRDHPMPEFTGNVRGVMLFSENVDAAQLAVDPPGVPLPGDRALRPFRARADGGHDAGRRPIFLLAAVRLPRARGRTRQDHHRAWPHGIRRRNELRQPRHALRALPHRRPRRALGLGAPRAAGVPRL